MFSPLGTAPGFRWRGMDVLKRRLGYGKSVALLIQAVLGIYPLLFIGHSGVAYHIASQISYT